MDFELSEEQRLLKDSVERLTTQRYDFETRKKYMAEPDGWSRAHVEAVRRSRPDRAAVRRGARRHRRRAGRDHDRDGGVRPRARARALFRDRRARRRLPAARRERRACKRELLPKVAAGETLLAFAHIERQARYDLADVATTAQEGRRRLRAQRREEPRAARRLRRQAHRLGARLRRPARPQRHRRCSWSTPRRRACRAAAIRRWTACAPPRSRSPNVKVGADAVIGEPGNAFPLIERVVDIGDRGACRRSGRRDERDARDHRRLPQAAQAVRRADRQLPGAAAPRRRHADRARAGALDGDARHHDERGAERRRAAQGDLRRQGADRPLGQDRRPAARSSCMAASA